MCTLATIILPIVSVWDPKTYSEHFLPWICTLEGLKMTQKESKNVALK